MSGLLDTSKLSKLELRALWRTGTKAQRRAAARELNTRSRAKRRENKQLLVSPNKSAVAAPTDSIIDPLADSRSGLDALLRDDVMLRFEGETHQLKLAEWWRSSRSQQVG